MPVFVGSSGDEIELRSDRVGFAVSTANPSSASAGDSYFNSTDKQLKVYNGSDWDSVGAGGGTSDGLIASGTLSDGSTVVINTDGTVSVVSQTAASSTTPVVYNSGASWYNSATYNAQNGKVVIAYKDNANSSYGTAIVGTVSGSSISFGTPVVFESGTATYIAVTYDSNSQKVVIAYQDHNNNYRGAAIVGTVSGTSISFGSSTAFSSANATMMGMAYDSNSNKVVIGYTDGNNSSYGTAVVGTVSGTSISFGSAVVFENRGGAGADHTSLAFDSNSNKVVFAYRYGSTAYGTAIVGTVSGTTITFGTPAEFHSSNTINITTAFDSVANKIIIAFRAAADSDKGKFVEATVSGTSISFSTPVVFESGNIYGEIGSVYDANADKTIVVYGDQGNSTYGTASIISSSSTNLTTSNFLGFSDGAYTNGQAAKIQIAGSVDDAQSSLTPGLKYYVQEDGSLGLSTGGPGTVLAGTAISSTKIIVRK